MTKLLQEAIEHLKELSDAEQDDAAAALIGYATAVREEPRLTEAQQSEVRRRLANPAPATIPFDEVFKRFQA